MKQFLKMNYLGARCQSAASPGGKDDGLHPGHAGRIGDVDAIPVFEE
jgi:hypothetical protein